MASMSMKVSTYVLCVVKKCLFKIGPLFTFIGIEWMLFIIYYLLMEIWIFVVHYTFRKISIATLRHCNVMFASLFGDARRTMNFSQHYYFIVYDLNAWFLYFLLDS